jgi:serine/threonine-protein kinase HipA
MNPTLSEYQSLLINSSTNESNPQILLDSCEEYMIGKEEARTIIGEVMEGVSKWRTIAVNLGISKREIDMFTHVYNKSVGIK